MRHTRTNDSKGQKKKKKRGAGKAISRFSRREQRENGGFPDFRHLPLFLRTPTNATNNNSTRRGPGEPLPGEMSRSSTGRITPETDEYCQPMTANKHNCGQTPVPPRAVRCTSRDRRSTTHGNDPSAGSPTETLLRLLLPLNDTVRATSRSAKAGPLPARPGSSPRISLNHSIGSSDGRCVQRAGT